MLPVFCLRTLAIQHLDQSVDLKDIKAIIDLMKKNSVSEFELEKEDFKIRLRRGGNNAMGGGSDEPTVIAYAPAQTGGGAAAPVAGAPVAKPPSTDVEINSPMIGTFYRSPSPESAA